MTVGDLRDGMVDALDAAFGEPDEVAAVDGPDEVTAAPAPYAARSRHAADQNRLAPVPFAH